MYNKKFIILLTFTIFTYITSVVHSQYIGQVSKFFINNKHPQYSYIDFIKSSYTSLPLLPFNILINILILSFISSVIYIMFISLFTKPEPNETSIQGNMGTINSQHISSSPVPIVNNKNSIENIDFTKFNLDNNKDKLTNFANKNPKLFKMGMNMFKGGASAKIKPINDNTVNDNIINDNIVNDKLKIKDTKGISSNNKDSKINGYRDYLKSLSDFSLTYSIFKWFLYVIIFNVIYFILFSLLIKTNIIKKNKMNEELYVKSIIHYYISGFYLSSVIIYFVTIANT